MRRHRRDAGPVTGERRIRVGDGSDAGELRDALTHEAGGASALPALVVVANHRGGMGADDPQRQSAMPALDVHAQLVHGRIRDRALLDVDRIARLLEGDVVQHESDCEPAQGVVETRGGTPATGSDPASLTEEPTRDEQPQHRDINRVLRLVPLGATAADERHRAAGGGKHLVGEQAGNAHGSTDHAIRQALAATKRLAPLLDQRAKPRHRLLADGVGKRRANVDALGLLVIDDDPRHACGADRVSVAPVQAHAGAQQRCPAATAGHIPGETSAIGGALRLNQPHCSPSRCTPSSPFR